MFKCSREYQVKIQISDLLEYFKTCPCLQFDIHKHQIRTMMGDFLNGFGHLRCGIQNLSFRAIGLQKTFQSLTAVVLIFYDNHSEFARIHSLGSKIDTFVPVGKSSILMWGFWVSLNIFRRSSVSANPREGL